jgi:hypothetical protein
MIINAKEGDIVTVILADGARLAGYLSWAGAGEVEVDGWVIDANKIQAWKLGVHPYRSPNAELKRKAKELGDGITIGQRTLDA